MIIGNMKRAYGRMLAATGGSLALLLLAPSIAYAQQSQSTSYQVNEVYFGPGGSLDASSPNYRADATVGDTAAGRQSGTNYNGVAGGQTNREESLELIINGPDRNIGYLSTSSSTTTTSSFTVKSYLSTGYVVMNASDPPRSSGVSPHTLNAMSPAGLGTQAPSPGTEQFGMNLRDNANPNVGTDPAQSPDATFSYGSASAGYSTPDQFRYKKGDVIANSIRSTGVTTYTVSYLFNISTLTPAGQYNFNHDIVATPTY